MSVQSFEALILPHRHQGERIPALRFGESRVAAILADLCRFACSYDGFSNAELRAVVRPLWPQASDYTSQQMAYDLRLLRLHGLIERLANKHRYGLTAKGRRVAFSFTKIYRRVFRSVSETLDPQIPSVLDSRLTAASRRPGENSAGPLTSMFVSLNYARNFFRNKTCFICKDVCQTRLLLGPPRSRVT